MKAPKKEKKVEDEEDLAFKAKKKQEQAELAAAKERATKSGPLVGGGIKKSGKK